LRRFGSIGAAKDAPEFARREFAAKGQPKPGDNDRPHHRPQARDFGSQSQRGIAIPVLDSGGDGPLNDIILAGRIKSVNPANPPLDFLQQIGLLNRIESRRAQVRDDVFDVRVFAGDRKTHVGGP
jgi:hypothetical protein